MPKWLLKLRNIASIIIFLVLPFSLLTACGESGDTDTGSDTGGGNTDNPQPLELTQTTPSSYQWVELGIGVDTYVDRDIVYTALPTSMMSQKVLQTANEDKSSTAESFISFNVNKSVIVYVAFDSRDSSVPTWLSTWTPSTDQIVSTDTTFNLYGKSYSAGTVTLGGSDSAGLSMYTVIIKPTDGVGSDPRSNATPVATDDSATTLQDTSVDINILANDIGLDDTPITTVISTIPTNGSATVQQGGTITYTPTTGYSGTDTFVYEITDSDGDSSTATVTIVVNAGSGGSTTPVANDDSATTTQNTSVNINISNNDTGLNDTPITTTILSNPANGTVTVQSSDVILYTPNTTFTGTDTFSYRIIDNDGETSTATVTVTVNSAPDTATPATNDDAATTQQDTAIDINVTANDTGLDDTPITTTIFSNPGNGSVTVQSSSVIRYTPDSGFAGTDTFVYRITDLNGDIATATVSVTVTCATCAADTTVRLSWDKNPDTISGYNVYYAFSTVATDASTLISTVSITANGFNPEAPSIAFDAWNDLQLNKGDSVCFRLKAYNSAGESSFSTGTCQQVPL